MSECVKKERKIVSIMHLLVIMIVLLPFAVHADDVEYVELQTRYTKMYSDTVVHDDYTVEYIYEIEIKALTDKAAKGLKKRRFSHSTSIEKYEVLDAYTLKANGDKIEVPEGNYQVTVNKGKGDNGAIFSDRTSVIIVFPDLEKNDSVYMKLKNVETEPMFKNNFNQSGVYWSQVAYDDVKISFDLPESMPFTKQVRGMEEKSTTENGRKKIVLTYKNVQPVKVDREDFSVWDESKEAGYALSTFNDYESIARAYAERALPKAVPTERIRKLAGEIVAGEKDKKVQARLLYDWVATNISYAKNGIGVGAVVPHDTDFILDNRMGDCKDHATLLQALYTSVGIKSTQALINSGASYSLPDIPVVSSVNHAINYIPEWDKFIDTTVSFMPFDRLAFPLSDKPVLLVEDFIPGKKTPPVQAGDNYQEIESKMKVNPDGSVTGNIQLQFKGRPAIELRRAWRHATQEHEEQWLEEVFSSNNNIGNATMKKDDPVPLLSDYSYTLEFTRPEFILPKGTSGFYVDPLVPTPMSLERFLNYAKEEIEGYDVACGNGTSIERLTYEFPENMKILAIPDNFEINENHISFKAIYKLENNILQVVREMEDVTPGNVCSPETINKQRQTLIQISDNMQSQVIYQH